MQIKRDIKLKQNKLKEIKIFSEYLSKFIKICDDMLEKFKPYESKPDNDFVDTKTEIEYFEQIKQLILLAVEGSKEDIDKNYEDYLELKEEKVRDYFFLVGGSKEANAECDDVKKQANGFNEIIVRHKNQIEEFNKDKKMLQDELKALNDTINLKSRELKTSLSKFSEEQFSDYFNCNKDL